MFCGRESQTGFKRHEIFIFNWNLPFICPASFFMCVLCLPFIISSEFIFEFILHVCNPNYIFKMQNLKKKYPKAMIAFCTSFRWMSVYFTFEEISGLSTPQLALFALFHLFIFFIFCLWQPPCQNMCSLQRISGVCILKSVPMATC